MTQASVQMDEELKNDILEIANRDGRTFAKMGYLLLQQAVKERKRIAAKNRSKQQNQPAHEQENNA